MGGFPEPKSIEEIQRAHDLLSTVITGELESPFTTPEERNTVLISANVLCWALGHAHNDRFAGLLKRIDYHIAKMGYALVKETVQ